MNREGNSSDSSRVGPGEALASASMDSFEMTVPADAGLPALVLSIPTGDDVDRITEICQDADIQEWTTIPCGYQRSDAQFFVERVVADGWSEGRELTWAVREAGDDGASATLVGMLSMTLSGPESARIGEIGYWLAAAARGSGEPVPDLADPSALRAAQGHAEHAHEGRRCAVIAGLANRPGELTPLTPAVGNDPLDEELCVAALVATGDGGPLLNVRVLADLSDAVDVVAGRDRQHKCGQTGIRGNSHLKGVHGGRC